MSILASDFEEQFASTQMGSICPYAWVGWISYVIENCPDEIRDKMNNEILSAFFATDVNLFAEMFGSAFASIIYRLGHMLTFMRNDCFIDCATIVFRKHPTLSPDPQFKFELRICLEGEELLMLRLPADPMPDWENGELYGVKNPYYQG